MNKEEKGCWNCKFGEMDVSKYPCCDCIQQGAFPFWEIKDDRREALELFVKLEIEKYKSQLREKIDLDFIYELRGFIKHNGNYDVQQFLIEKLLEE